MSQQHPDPYVRPPGAAKAMALTLPGLVCCVAVFIASPHDRLFDDVTLLLAGCTVVANVAWVDLDDRLLIDGSFVPSLLAMAFLGPAAAFFLVVVGEVGSWVVRRYRAIVMPINMFGLGLPAILGAIVVELLSPRGVAFYAILPMVGFAALALNDLLLTSLIGVLDAAPIAARLRHHLRLLPALGINVFLALATARLYASEGLIAIAVVLVLILAFNYMVSQMLKAQRRAERIGELAASRQRLVVEALGAEERERRDLSERLHDEAVQDMLLARQELAEARRGEPQSLARADMVLAKALDGVRQAVTDLHPSVLAENGLAASLSAVAEREARLGGFCVDVAIEPDVDCCHARLLFRVARELLRNINKHAGARSAGLRIWRTPQEVVVAVWDDGRGFPPSALKTALAAGHVGLASVRERVEALGGRFEPTSELGQGSRFRVCLPCPSELGLCYRASANTSSAAAGGPQDPMRAE